MEQQIRRARERGERNLRDLSEAAAARHHDLELLERDEAVAVLVDALDHAAALRDGGGLAEAPEDARELGGGDGAVAVGVEDAERVAEVLLDCRRVAGHRRVQRRELVQADEAVAVRVRLGHHPRHLVVGGRVAQALEQRGELRPRDPTVAVRVELAEHARHLLLRGRRPRRGPGALALGRRLLLWRRRLGAAAEQGRHGHPDLPHGGSRSLASLLWFGRVAEAWPEGSGGLFGLFRHGGGCGFVSETGGVFIEAGAGGGAFSIIDHGSEPCKPGRRRKLRALAVAAAVPACGARVGSRTSFAPAKWFAVCL